MMNRYLAAYDDFSVANVVDLDRAVIQRQRVAEGDQIVGALGGHNA